MSNARKGFALAISTLSVAAFLVPQAALATAASGSGSDGRTDPSPAQTVLGEAPGGLAWSTVLRNQDRLHTAADAIVAAHGKGFGGIRLSPETNTLTVAWKGKPDAASQKALDRAATVVRLDVKAAKHTQAQLEAAALRIARTAGVTSVAALPDGSGVAVTHDGRAKGRAKAFGGGLASTAGVDVVVDEAAVSPQAASRGDDFAPYWGGARYSTGGSCSTGFAVNQGGYTRMLSAGHCGSNWQSAYDGGGQYMGYIYGDDNANDTLLIDARSAGRIYDGGVGVGEFSKPVIGAQASYVGDWICQSGSYSGATCNIKVVATNVTVNVGYLIYGNVQAEQANRTNFMGNGDSGGPVFSLAWWDYNKIFAKGTNTAIDLGTSVACTGVPAGGGRSCAWRGWYQDVTRALSRYGASIVTG